MTDIVSKNFLSNPLYFSKNQIMAQKEKIMAAQRDKNAAVISSTNGTDNYKDTINPGGYIAADMNTDTFPKENILCTSFQNQFSMQKTQLDQVLQIASNAKNEMMRLSNGDVGSSYENFIARIKNCLKDLTFVMNQNKFLSGVSETKQSVVDLESLDSINMFDPITTDYYLGDNPDMNVTIHDTQINKYPISGDDPLFRNLIHCLRSCLSYTPNDSGRDNLRSAQLLCDNIMKHDYIIAKGKVESELSTVNYLINKIPDDLINQEKAKIEITNQDKLLAIQQYLQTMNSIDISETLATRNIMNNRNFIDTLARL